MYCTHCGSELDSDAKFCGECGTATGKTQSPTEMEDRNGENHPSDDLDTGDVRPEAHEDMEGVDVEQEPVDGGPRIGRIVGYVVGVLLALTSISLLADGEPVAGILMGLAALVALPPARETISGVADISLGKWATVGLVLFLAFGSAMALGPAETDSNDFESDDSITEPIDEVEDDEQLSDEEILMAFELSLIEAGFDVESVTMDGANRMVMLNYYSTAQTEADLAGEVGYVGGSYAASVNMGWSPGVIDVHILDAHGNVAGSYYIESEWAQDYYDGRISDEEYFTLILETFESG